MSLISTLGITVLALACLCLKHSIPIMEGMFPGWITRFMFMS
jgi:hypothetical protein